MRRARMWRAALAAAGLGLLGIVTAGLLGWAVLTERGVTFGLAELPELRHADAPAIGANTFLHREADPAKVERELELLARAGIGLIRQEIQWVEIEPHAKGVYIDNHGEDSWAKFDRMVDLARGFGIEVLARLDRPPPWATPGFNPQVNPSIQMPPADFTDFADFAAAVAERYRGRVKYFQIWNEPNLFGEWGGRPPDPAAYLDMLREVGAAVRAANPDAVIVLAGLAPTIETGPDNLSDLLFLERLYQLGAKGAFDVASSMSYGLFTGPRDPRIEAPRTNFPRAVLWREIMEAHGDAGTPIWASEYGWMSLPPGWQGNQGIWGNHSAADQAAWTVDGFRRARDQWPWLPTIIIWASRWPHDTHPDDPTPFFGLLTKDLEPRDPLLALERADAAAPIAGIGLHQETHAAFTFDGPWPRVPSDWASLGFHRQTGQPDARLELRFEGDSVGLLTRRGPDMGQVRVRIDGHSALADALPRNAAGEAILNLYAPAVERLARIPIARGLSQGPHRLELTVMAERDPQSSGGLVIVDGALVGNSRPLWPYAGVAGAWALALAVLVWAVGGRIARAAARLPRIDVLDRRLPLGLHAGEVAAGVLAVVFALLPDGTPTSAWTLLRLVLAAALGALALARPRHVAIVAVAAIPFVGVIARTGIYDRPVGETLIVILVIAWAAHALAHRRWPWRLGPDQRTPEQDPSFPRPTPSPLVGLMHNPFVIPAKSLPRTRYGAGIHQSLNLGADGIRRLSLRLPGLLKGLLVGEGGGEGSAPPSFPRRACPVLDTGRESTAHRRWLPVQASWFWLALAVIAAGIATTVAADFPRVAWRDLRTVIVEPALLFLVLLSVMRDRTDAQRLGVALVLGAVVSAVIALALIPTGAVVIDAGPPRLRGLFGSPNNLALILERALPVTVGLALVAASRPRLRIAAWAAVALLLAVLVLTFSRGAWIGALAGLAFALFPVWRRQSSAAHDPDPRHSGEKPAPYSIRGRNPVRMLRRLRTATPLLMAGLVAAGLVAAIITTGGDNLARLLRPSDAATAARPLLWDSAWRMIADNPVLGIGPDNFLYHYPDYIRPEAWAEPNISHAHNIALDTWLTLGIPGLVVVVAVLAVYARTWRSALRRSTDGSRALVFGLGGAMLATLVHGIVDSSLYLPELAATFWVVVALTVMLAAPPPSFRRKACPVLDTGPESSPVEA